MAKFLFTVWPFVGHVHNSITVARELSRRGHEIGFYTGARACPGVEAEGFRAFPFRGVDEARVEWLVLGADGLTASHRNPFKLSALWVEWLLGTVPGQLVDLEHVLEEWRPDVIVCDPAMWAPILVLGETHSLPVAVLLYTTACLLPGRDGPLLFTALPRPRRWHSRLLYRLARGMMDVISVGARRRANTLRRPYGLTPLTVSVTEHAGRMPLYLLPSLPELDYERKDLPPSVQYVGPLPWTEVGDEPPPKWLQDLPAGARIVYVTEGTAQPQEPILLRAAVRGLTGLDARVVLTTGKLRDPEALGLGVIPPNVRVERWVPHRHLIPRIGLLVTNGGTGTLTAALQEGIPLVVVPMHWEQEETAWRIVEAGVGVRLAPRDCTPTRLRAAVEQVLTEPAFRRNARRVGGLLRRAPGPRGAADLLGGLIGCGNGVVR